MNHASLFSGIGGLDLAAHWAGMKSVVFCEREPYCQQVLRRRFAGVPIIDDIRDFTRERLDEYGIGRIDVISGGFPCQPFSNAGKRTGTDDDRYLWPEMCRVIGDVRPSWVIAENVDGLISMAQSDSEIVMEDETTLCTEAEMVLESIRKDFKEIGYQSIPIVLPAAGVGAMHRRYRILILAHAAEPGLSQRGRCGAIVADSTSCNGLDLSGIQSGLECQQGRGFSSDTGLETRCETMADSSGERCGEAREHSDRSAQRTSGSGEVVADTTSERRGAQWAESTGEQGRLCSCGRCASCQDVAYASGAGQQKRHVAAVAERQGYHTGGDAPGRPARAAQSGMGGMFDEFSPRLDGRGVNPLDALIDFISSCPQVAPLGMQPYEWEPPRVATGIKNRAARLKALGNAVDPLQALPVMYGIRVLHELNQ